MLRNLFFPRPRVGTLFVGRTLGLLIALSLLTMAAPSFGAIVPIAPPASVLPGALTSNTNSFVFQESTQTLQAPLAVDIITPGTYTLGNPYAPGVIPAGTRITSYFVHRDTVSNQFKIGIGVAVSPTKILGIIASDANLDATDLILGNGGTAYPTGLAFRGLELNYAITPDTLIWNANGVTITAITPTMQVVDQFRVIAIAPVPEPTTLLMAGMGAGLLACAGWRSRRRRR